MSALLHIAEYAVSGGCVGAHRRTTSQNSMNGLQGGDPAKLAQGWSSSPAQEASPVRWAAGADAVAAVE